jgi:S-adenosylmethionine:tRNA ribosyltransferase-isomerase
MRTSDFDYALPPELIATVPAARRDGSRLMLLGRRAGEPTHLSFEQIVEHVPPHAVIVLNDTRVMPARLRGHKPSGGAIELLLLRRLDRGDDGASTTWEAMGRNLANVAVGSPLVFDGGLVGELVGRDAAAFFQVRLRAAPGVEGGHRSLLEQLEQAGELPLPPYIEAARRRDAERDAGAAAARDLRALDRERYQTVYAREAGAVAAPTAGLHFTQSLLDALAARGHVLARLTLHVGPGTFRPVKTDDAESHQMDAEWYTIPAETAAAINGARTAGRAVLAVGTTVVRALESAARGVDGGDQDGAGGETAARRDEPRPVRAGPGSTRLFLRPGASFHVVTDLLTNFHLPRSTLLMLVSAFAGRDRVLGAYRAAVEARYRFYSYGDAMLIRGSE